MTRVLYVAARHDPQGQRLDTVANNIANINTNGYKDQVVTRAFRMSFAQAGKGQMDEPAHRNYKSWGYC